MKDYIEDTFDDIEADIYAVLGRINAIRMDIHGVCLIPDVKREWRGLTNEALDEVVFDCGLSATPKDIARAIEAKLKELNHD